MPTTFSVFFRNRTVDSLTGRNTTGLLTHMHFLNGAQPSAPDVAAVGASVFGTTSTSGIPTTAFMSSPALGISTLAGPRSLNAINTASSITFGRWHDANNIGGGVIDMDATLSSGSGGVIVPSLSATAGVAFQIDRLSLRLPQTLGTVMLNADLVNALVSAWVITAANVNALGSATVQVYSGAAPATADAVATGTLLVSFTTAAAGASWVTATGGSAGLVSNLAAVAAATGTAGYVRITKSAFVLQGSVGTASGNFILDTVSITSGATITLTEATISI